jgi:hypothetical protein
VIQPFRRLVGPFSLVAGLGALALVAIAAPIAQASVVSLGACDNSALTRPFMPWIDFNTYKLAPGGDFEGSMTGWSLVGGAAQTASNEPYDVGGSGSSSLSLPAGASATSPQTCVSAAYPDFRFFARTDTPGSVIAVSVVYGSVTIPVGIVALSGEWMPTLPMTTLSPIAGALNGGTANVSLQFTELFGRSQIDDVYVDPMGHG